MRSSICVFYIALFWLPHAAAAQADDPDALYRERATVARARDAAAIWEARLQAQPANFDAAWKLSRAMYWIGGHDKPAGRRPALERGVEAGRAAARIDPKRPEGHFWMAANMGALAESYGLRLGLKYRGAIKDALERVLRIDAGYQQGSADRALGRWYLKVPSLFGGSKKESEEHLRRSLAYDPNSTASHYFLADTLFAMDRDAEARNELKRTIAAPIDPEWEPEDREFKQLAEERLRKTGAGSR